MENNNKKGIITLAIVVILSVAVMFGIKLAVGTSESTAKGYAAGEYVGVGKGMHGDLYVKVVFGETDIKSVEVLEHKETAGISDPAIEQMPEKIVNAQSVEVDGISGATLTSNGIKEAVENAQQQARGELPRYEYVEVVKPDPTPLELSYNPGEYTAKAEGFEGPVEVKVVFSETDILSVEVLSHHDTEEICATALTLVPERIVYFQTYEVDAASGATWTSKGITDAVKLCVEQAKK